MPQVPQSLSPASPVARLHRQAVKTPFTILSTSSPENQLLIGNNCAVLHPPVSHQVPRATRGWRTEWAALAPQWRKQRQWQWRRQQRPWLALTLLEERECDGGGQQEEGLDWGKVGRLMSKDVDQLQQSREGWSAEVRLPRAEQHPWNTGGDPSHGSHLTPPTQGQTYE